MPRLSSKTLDFRGGLVSPVSPYAGDHVRSMSNCWFSPDDWGAVQAMPGFARYGSVPSPIIFADSIHVGFDEAGSFTSRVYVSDAASGGKLYRHAKTSYAEVKSSIATPLVSVQIRNNLVFVNGTDPPFQVDLTDDSVSDVGVARADSTNASTSLAGGKGVRGVVRYWIAELSGTTEGALSAVFGEIDCGEGNSVDVDLTHADFLGNTYRIYRTLQDSSEPFQVVESFAGGATYTDSVPDSDLLILPYLHGDPPPTGLISIITQFNRLWGITAAGRLYWSDLIDHESWWTASNGNWIEVYVGDGDRATGLALSPDGIFVFKDHHIYHVYTQNLGQLQVTPITLGGASQRSVGSSNQRSIITTRRGVAFYHDANIYFLQGFTPVQIGDAISEDFRSLSQTVDAGIVLGHSERNGHLWVSSPIGTYIYDFQRRQWIGVYSYTFLGYAEDGSAFLGCGGTGSTNQQQDAHTLYSGNTDSNGDAIACSCELSPTFGSSAVADKLFHGVDVLLKRQTADSGITLTSIFDSDTTNTIVATVAMNASGSTQERLRRVVNLGFRGRELGVKLSSTTADPQWTVYNVTPSWHEYRSSSRRA